ncbi:LysR family transcriptional regulator [Ramlibacter sp. AW1]|uniref:LysR family transcriptional regulator n=1 Tax=Ramlibacter aurantiacus TaxID=2801330 RepID=A0A936ZU01_9BURK|nr:LysR family transcriptional regulator [Ramlibacter aurantiacus]MBL0420584.1 LysR family transcriptional regulator [Ramlibacter aurantiacus]
MDRLLSMRVFQQVVDEGSFAAAARRLDLAPAVVTRLVSDLERHLGVRLLHRTTRRLALTQAGESYLERLRGILVDIEDASDAAQAQTQEMKGTVRVLAPPVAAAHVLAGAAVDFQRLHPGVNVEVHVEDASEPPVHEFDLAVLTGLSVIDPEVIVRPIVQSVAVLCASPEYLARHGDPRDPQALLQHRLLRLRPPSQRPGPVRLIDPTDGDRTLQLDLPAVLTANHTDTLLRATLEGGGISMQPVDLLVGPIRDGSLRRVLAPWITGRLRLVAAIPSRQYMPLRTRAFVDHLVDYARRNIEATRLEIGPT